jgi:hypothetical protein
LNKNEEICALLILIIYYYSSSLISIPALSNIAENTAFFGDLILRLPDITHNIFDRKKDWNILLGWSIGFCNSTGLFHGNDGKLLHLVSIGFCNSTGLFHGNDGKLLHLVSIGFCNSTGLFHGKSGTKWVLSGAKIVKKSLTCLIANALCLLLPDIFFWKHLGGL